MTFFTIYCVFLLNFTLHLVFFTPLRNMKNLSNPLRFGDFFCFFEKITEKYCVPLLTNQTVYGKINNKQLRGESSPRRLFYEIEKRDRQVPDLGPVADL